MAETLALHGMGTRASMTSLRQLVEDFERHLILAALEQARGNQRRAAAELGCLPTTLNEKMRRLGLRACDRSPANGSGERGADSDGPELIGNA